MKKVAYVFVLAVFVPSLLLAYLAIRSLRDQQFVLERQQSILYQGIADSFARDAQNVLADRQREFVQQVENLLRAQDANRVAKNFDDQIAVNGVMPKSVSLSLCRENFCRQNQTAVPKRALFPHSTASFFAANKSWRSMRAPTLKSNWKTPDPNKINGKGAH